MGRRSFKYSSARFSAGRPACQRRVDNSPVDEMQMTFSGMSRVNLARSWSSDVVTHQISSNFIRKAQVSGGNYSKLNFDKSRRSKKTNTHTRNVTLLHKR